MSNPLLLTEQSMAAILPAAPKVLITAIVRNQDELAKVGILDSRPRFAMAITECEHESGGGRVLVENVNYTPTRAAQIWPSRFKSAADCLSKVGSWQGDPDFRRKLMSSVYGSRMGNRPNTDDGYRYIGRALPQITGRDGYRAIEAQTGIPVVDHPEVLEKPEWQAHAIAGFVAWKKLNTIADTGDFTRYTKVWNGGLIGQSDRQARLKGNEAIIGQLRPAPDVDRIIDEAKKLPGGPLPGEPPPPEAIKDATKNERRARNGGAGGAVAGAGNEGAKVGTQTADKPNAPLLPSYAAYGLVAVGVAVFVVATILIARKKAAVIANWF